MNVFADLHHSGLFFSLHLLLEGRLGFNLYRPIGLEWFEKGWWHVAKPYDDNPATVMQYLSHYKPEDGSPPLNRVFDVELTHTEIEETEHHYFQKAITLDQFINMKIDLIIASIPAHWRVYKKLRDIYHPKAKVICQMGNMFSEVHEDLRNGTVDNLMASTSRFEVPKGIPTLFYHQEIPVVPFKPPSNEAYEKPQITSFVHLLPEKELFEQYKQAMPEITWKAYGAGCPDGWKNGIKNIYEEMRKSLFIWHVKPHGDGFGWVWHSAFMVGRPVITEFSQYRDKLGGILFEDMKTGIDLEKGNIKHNVKLIREMMNRFAHRNVCKRVRQSFDTHVDYNKKEQDVREFLARLR